MGKFNYKRVLKVVSTFYDWARNGRFDKIYYTIHTRFYGLDYTYVSLNDLGLSASRSNWHSPSGGADLTRVLRSLGIPSDSRALDLGCGKGAAVLTMARFPFEEIVGVDLSGELVDVAKTNAARVRQTKVRFVCSDAADFLDLGRFTHLYLYNPFPDSVMKSVMQNLVASIHKGGVTSFIIYKNPVCHKTIIESGLFAVEKDYTFGSDLNETYRIYRSKASRSGEAASS